MGNNYRLFSGVLTDGKTLEAINNAVQTGSSFTTDLTLYSKSGIPQQHLISVCPIYFECRNTDPLLVCYVAVHVLHHQNDVGAPTGQLEISYLQLLLGSISLSDTHGHHPMM